MGARQSCGKACSNCAADCTRPSQGYGDDIDDERPVGDPAGATFEETLEDLNNLDRHLMLFCATSNLSAVRWLLHLGAHWNTCDANATTCLHVACRSGGLATVKEIMKYPSLLEAVDIAGWTPLHIAVLMGRREVVVRLLQAGAPPHLRNSKGQMAAELCADNGTYEALRSFEMHAQQHPGKTWVFQKDTGPGEDIIGSRLQYEPFFVPRQAIIRSQHFKKEFQKIGMAMFNRQPGYGLAFLVASGVARDYPVDMSTFLRKSKVDIRQVGSFLGEAFSLSHTIRLEFINSVLLQNTGVVTSLIQVFRMLQLPDDLQKINRLVHGVARIWWRQHERMVKDMNGVVIAPTKEPPGDTGPREELVGLELKQYLTSSDALHQLMFSTVLLHWYLYKDGTGPKKEMEFHVWQKLNRGVESNGTDVPEHVQQQIHTLVSKAFIGELAVATTSGRNRGDAAGGGPDEGAGGHGPADEANRPNERQRSPTLANCTICEGWAQIVGGGFPRPSGLTGVQTVTYRHVSNIFSESTQSSGGMLRHPAGGLLPESARSALASAPGSRTTGTASSAPRRDDYVWLSLACTLLFFSAAPATGAPFAFVQLQKVCISRVQAETNTLCLAGIPEQDDADADLAAAGGTSHAGSDAHALSGTQVTITIVLLLPDGRWQELSLPKLELCFATSAELKMWSDHIAATSDAGRSTRSTTKSSGIAKASPGISSA